MYSWPGLGKALLIGALVLLAARCWPTPDGAAAPPAPEPDEIVAALVDAMVVVEAEEVTRLRTTSSCRRIEYRRGAFAQRAGQALLQRDEPVSTTR